MNKKDFLDLLELGDEEIEGLTLRNIIDEFFPFAEEIWKDVKFRNYPDHGLDHSYRVLKYALEVNKIMFTYENQLSKLERMILGASALLHDIGMQYQYYFHEENETKDDNEVRESHCTLGDKMFEVVLRDEKERADRGLPELNISRTRLYLYGSIIYYIRLVSFSHHPGKGDKKAMEYWSLLNSSNYNADGVYKGEIPCRLKLLGGLLRFGDELDMDQRRLPLPSMSRLDSSNLTEENKAHWFSCYYTERIEITYSASGSGSLEIHLDWMAPNNDRQIDLVWTLLHNIREIHFYREASEISPYLIYKEGILTPTIKLKINDVPEKLPLELCKAVPKGVEKLLNDRLNYALKRFEEKKPKNLIPLVKDNSIEAKRLAETFIKTTEGVINKHYALKTHWHTSEYIKCRELVADPVFTESLVKELTNYFKTFGFTRIVAQGTSAIRIGSILSITLGTKFSYANGNIKFQFEEPNSEDFKEYERIVTVSSDDKILILDDIIGVGNVFSDIVSQLIKNKFSGENFVFFYIYSVGYEKEDLKKYPNVKVYYLTAFPDVEYWKEGENGRCERCKNDKNEPDHE